MVDVTEPPSGPDSTLGAIVRLLGDRTGICITDQDMDRFATTVGKCGKAAGAQDAAAYLRTLQGRPTHDSGEWDALIGETTVQESYFFRDKGLFALLEHQILPELIEHNRENRQLRIWSAGCAAGEEPYSLAMLVDSLLPDCRDWNLCIVGSDINRGALERARRGEYGEWSFRGVDPAWRDRYFQPVRQGWRIRDEIRERVRFNYCNLVAGDFPRQDHELQEMDLVLCRNLFIYFHHDAVAAVLPRLGRILRTSGYLVTGHGELFAQALGSLEYRVFPESVVYRRTAAAPQTRAPGKSRPAVPVPVPSQLPEPEATPPPRAPKPAAAPSPGQNLLDDACALFAAGACTQAIDKARQAAGSGPDQFAALLLMTRAYGDLGQYDEAEQAARTAMKVREYEHQPYYLLAHIEQLRDRARAAARLLEQVIYLQPDFVPAYLDLAAVVERSGNDARARTLRRSALSLLRSLPPEAGMEPYQGVTVRDLTAYVSSQVAA